jgi:uncharacterized protein (TIGR03382 family)
MALCLFAGLLVGIVPTAKADVIATVAEYNGPADFDFTFSDYPLASALVGDFTFSIPAGQFVYGGSISGTFGNNDVEPTTALSDYFVDGGAIQVAGCDNTVFPCFSGNGSSTPIPWSYTFTTADLTTLSGELSAGSVDFTVVQNFAVSVQTGVTTLDLLTTPEPGTFAAAFGTLAGFALLLRRRSAR